MEMLIYVINNCDGMVFCGQYLIVQCKQLKVVKICFVICYIGKNELIEVNKIQFYYDD